MQRSHPEGVHESFSSFDLHPGCPTVADEDDENEKDGNDENDRDAD